MYFYANMGFYQGQVLHTRHYKKGLKQFENKNISYFILQNSSTVVRRKKSSYGNNLGLFASNNCSKGRKAISSCLKAITSVAIQSNAGTPGITSVGTHNLHCFDFLKTCLNFGDKQPIFIHVCNLLSTSTTSKLTTLSPPCLRFPKGWSIIP